MFYNDIMQTSCERMIVLVYLIIEVYYAINICWYKVSKNVYEWIFFFKLDKLRKKTYTNIIVKFITMLNLS